MGIRSAIRELFRRERPPRRRMYQGATISRLTSDWVSSGTSADSEIRGSLTRLRNRSRQLVRDNDFARQAIRTVQNNVVGTGIGFQSQVRMQRGSGRLDQAVNDAIEMAWKTWGRKENCDVGGRLSFSDIERLIVRSVAESGEVIVRLVQQQFGSSTVPLGIEIIESDLLLDDMNGTAPNGNEIRMGVEIDRWGRPTAYYFEGGFRHPGDFQFPASTGAGPRYNRIPADEILHLYLVERPGQTRGVPWLSSAIERMHHLHGYEQAEVVAARASSALMGFVQSPEGELYGDAVENGERLTDFRPGMFHYLNPGETVVVPNLTRPGGEFDPFMRAMLRAVAAGVGCSYESLSKDFSQSNYSSSRLSLLEERDNWKQLQQWLISNFHQPLFERWLDLAVLSGALDLPRYETDPTFYRRPRWMPRGWQWVDPAKEVKAAMEAVQAGFKTQAEIIAEAGGDIEEVFRERRRELDLAEELGLDFSTKVEVQQPVQPEQGIN